MERIAFLRRVRLLAALPTADLRQVAEIASEQHFTDGVAVVRQGDPGNELHVIAAGHVRVVVDRDGASSEVARRGPGDVVGEMALIGHETRSATLIAIGDVRTLVIAQPAFEALLRQRPDTCLALLREVAGRLREVTLGQTPAATPT
jgi:CRP-like cAMP-binding protein